MQCMNGFIRITADSATSKLLGVNTIKTYSTYTQIDEEKIKIGIIKNQTRNEERNNRALYRFAKLLD